MSTRELGRLEVISRVVERRLTQRRAAEQLGLSVRQVERLCCAFRVQGAAGLASRKRGRPSNRRLDTALRDRAVQLIRERYADFGPTLALEKLRELHALDVSVETLRKWMIEAGLWVPRSRRPRRVHPPRSRRAALGELVQIDGSDHEWLEERGPRCTLLVYVDDATGRLMELRLVPRSRPSTTSRRRGLTSSATASRSPSIATRRAYSASHARKTRSGTAKGVLHDLGVR